MITVSSPEALKRFAIMACAENPSLSLALLNLLIIERQLVIVPAPAQMTHEQRKQAIAEIYDFLKTQEVN